MENNKSMGFLPKECVNIILDIYNIQNEKRNKLLNEIELFGKLSQIVIKSVKCLECNNYLVNLTDDNFFYYVNLAIKFKTKNKKLFETFIKHFHGIPIIENIKAHDIFYSERYECYYCKNIFCYGCVMIFSNNKDRYCPYCNVCISN